MAKFGNVSTNGFDASSTAQPVEYSSSQIPDPLSIPVGAVINLHGGGLMQSAGNRLVPVAESAVSKAVSAAVRLHPSYGAAGTGTITAAVGTHKTCDQQLPAPTTFKGVRLIYANYDTAAVMPIAKAKVAAAPRHLASTGTQMTWQSVTFDGATSASVPAAVHGASQSAPGILISDMIPVQSVARSDGGSRRLIRLRTLIDGSSAEKTVTCLTMGGNLSDFNAASWNNGYQLGVYSPTGDLVTTTADSSSVLETGGPVMAIGAIFITDTQIDTLAAFGDSLIQGGQTTNSSAGWPTRLTMLDAGICCVNFGSGGQKTQDTYMTLKKYLKSHKPTYAAFKSWSPNDSYNLADFDTAWAYCMAMIDECRANGVVPVVLTSGPVNSYTTGQNALRLAQNVKTLALRKLGVIVVDAAHIVTAAGTDNTINPSYDSGDHLHYNDAGHSALCHEVGRALGFL